MASSLPYKTKWSSWIPSSRKASVEVVMLVLVMQASAMVCRPRSVIREAITLLYTSSKLTICRCLTSVKATKWKRFSNLEIACPRRSKIVWASGWIHNRCASITIRAWTFNQRTQSYCSHSIVSKSTLIPCCQWLLELALPICNSLSSLLNNSSSSLCSHNNNSWWDHLRLNLSNNNSSNNKSHLKPLQHPIWWEWWALIRTKLLSTGALQGISNL